MSFSSISSILLAILMSILNVFPGSYMISDFCGMLYTWDNVTETIVEALEERDSETLVSMAAPGMLDENPDLKEDLDKMFSSIEGEVIAEEDYIHHHDQEASVSLTITTSENVYFIDVNYRAFDSKSKQKELGIRRILMSSETDEMGSRWINPENFFATDDINTEYTEYTRTLYGVKDKTKDSIVFMVPEDDDIIINGYSNVKIQVYRNEANEIHFPYQLNEEDEVTVYLVKEGKEPSIFSYKYTFKGTDRTSYKDCDVKKGNYYLYIESNNHDILYDIRVSANL